MDAFNKLFEVFSKHQAGLRNRNPYENFTIENHIVEHRAFCQALQRVTNLHKRGLSAGVAGGLLITGQTGSGKTTLLKFYKSYFPPREERARRVVPVLFVTTPDSPSVKDFAETILTALGDPAASKGYAKEKTERIYQYLQKCGVELILIDEFQHFYDSGKRSQAKKVTDWLKNLFNIAKIPVVLAGLPRSFMVVRNNPQLRRRFASPFYLRPFSFDSDDGRKEFRGVLKAVHDKLPLPCPMLHEANMAQRFYYATHGLFDYVKKIIDGAVWEAGENGLEALNQELFEQVFEKEIWPDAPKQLNPFNKRAKFRLLNKSGEPFEIWDDPAQYMGRKAA